MSLIAVRISDANATVARGRQLVRVLEGFVRDVGGDYEGELLVGLDAIATILDQAESELDDVEAMARSTPVEVAPPSVRLASKVARRSRKVARR